jgi:hypothetical protein
MHRVEVRLRVWKIADALGEMRKWLDHYSCVPVSFDIVRAASGALLVCIEFNQEDMAKAFQRDFGDGG